MIRSAPEARKILDEYDLLFSVGADLFTLSLPHKTDPMPPGMPLIQVAYLSQVANGILLPVVLIFMLILSNRKDLLGSMTNSRVYNLIAGGTAEQFRAYLQREHAKFGRLVRDAGIRVNAGE